MLPVKPGGQVHEKLPATLVQLAPFWQGEGSQPLRTCSHNWPVVPEAEKKI